MYSSVDPILFLWSAWPLRVRSALNLENHAETAFEKYVSGYKQSRNHLVRAFQIGLLSDGPSPRLMTANSDRMVLL